MARPQGNGNGFDTIDLTLSSPEPEPQPRIKEQPTIDPETWPPWSRYPPNIPLIQQDTGRFPRVKEEVAHAPRIKPESGQPSNVQKNPSPLGAAPSHAYAGAQQQVHPSHLSEIIATTSSSDLRKVLLELCQLSPALSGALVRGLAPYSTNAQNIVGRYRAGGRPPLSSQKISHSGQRLRDQTSQVRHHTHAIHSTPPAQRDSYGPSAPSNWRSSLGRPSTPSPDRELRRPGPSAQKAMRPDVIRAPLRRLPWDSSTINRTSNADIATRKMTETQKANPQTTKTCIKCHEPFFDDSQPCVYHPGRKTKQEDGTIVWTCCMEDTLTIGCHFGGSHTTDSTGWEDEPGAIVA